jgi:hypothetical protein
MNGRIPVISPYLVASQFSAKLKLAVPTVMHGVQLTGLYIDHRTNNRRRLHVQVDEGTNRV